MCTPATVENDEYNALICKRDLGAALITKHINTNKSSSCAIRIDYTINSMEILSLNNTKIP